MNPYLKALVKVLVRLLLVAGVALGLVSLREAIYQVQDTRFHPREEKYAYRLHNLKLRGWQEGMLRWEVAVAAVDVNPTQTVVKFSGDVQGTVFGPEHVVYKLIYDGFRGRFALIERTAPKPMLWLSAQEGEYVQPERKLTVKPVELRGENLHLKTAEAVLSGKDERLLLPQPVEGKIEGNTFKAARAQVETKERVLEMEDVEAVLYVEENRLPAI